MQKYQSAYKNEDITVCICNIKTLGSPLRGYTFTQELVPKGTIKNLPIFTQELHYGNYLPTCICLFSHRNYEIVTGYQFLGKTIRNNLSSITWGWIWHHTKIYNIINQILLNSYCLQFYSKAIVYNNLQEPSQSNNHSYSILSQNGVEILFINFAILEKDGFDTNSSIH